MVGTRKGLWLGRSDDERATWEWSGPAFDMQEVYSCMVDTRGVRLRLLAGSASSWLGTNVYRSDDLGDTWDETPNGAIRFPEDTGTSLERIWQLQPGVSDDVVWAGTEPGAVFKSEDRGETFTLERALWDHPHRLEWGAGFGGQAFHTLLPHPRDPDSVTAAISSGGVYQTDDGGQSWTARNTGIKTEFMPDDIQYPEFGQCVHKMARHPEHPDRVYLQNHGGVYRSDDGGESWHSIAAGLPAEFGFPIVVHPYEPDTVYVFPLVAAFARRPPEARARVWRSRDAGEHWEELGRDALPESFYVGVMRDAMCMDTHDTAGIYFGARNGSVWASTDGGDDWQEIARDLPDVMCVRASVI